MPFNERIKTSTEKKEDIKPVIKNNTSAFYDRLNFDNNSTTKVEKSKNTSKSNINLEKNIKSISEKINRSDFLRENIGIIEDISKLKLKDETKKEISILLENILNTTDETVILGYLTKIQGLTNNYQEKKGGTVKKSIDESKSILDSIKGFFLDSKTLNDIQDITIDGKVENMQEFQNKLSKLILVLNNDSQFSQLPNNQKNKIIEGLKKVGSGLEKEKNKTLDFLDNKINAIAKQIENQDDDGSISITIEGVKIPDFKSKEEAFAHIKNIKEEAEKEFQNFIADMGDFLGKTLGQIFTTTLPLKPYIYTKDSISDGIENYQNNEHWALLVIDGIQIIALTLASVNYTETIYRRIITDNIARSGIKKGFLSTKIKILDKDGKDTGETRRVRKNIRIPDYDLSDTNYFSSDSQDVELRNEYKQRITTIAKLEQQLETITDPKDKSAFAKELNNMKSYININTNTFWLKAYSLNKEQGKFKRLLNVFINGPTGLHLRDNATRNILLDKKSRKKLEEGADFVFKDASIDFDDKTGQINSITENGESDNIKNIRKYINNVSDTQRKKDVLSRFDKYIESLKNNPKSKNIIENDINNIVENNYLNKKETLKLIEKKYFKELKTPEKREKGFVNWVKEIGDDLVFKKDQFNKIVSEVWGNLAPASFTYKKAMAIKFKQIVSNGSWKGNDEDLKNIFDKIDSGKLEINQIYPGISKYKIIVDSFKGFIGKYGVELPQLHKLNNLGKKGGDLEDIIKQGKEISKEINKAKEIFNKKGELTDNIKNIFELDTFNFPSTDSSLYGSQGKEQYFKNMFNDLENFSKSDDFNLNSEKVKVEIIKLNNGYLTNKKIISILENTFTDEELKKDNIKDFIKKVETGKMVISLGDLNTHIPNLKLGTIIQEKIVNFNISDEIDRINSDGKKLGEIHFKNQKFGIFNNSGEFLKDSFEKNELDLAKILNFRNTAVDLDSNFGNFLEDINNNGYTSVEFFEKLNNSLNLSISIDENTVRKTYSSKLLNKVSEFYNSLDSTNKKLLIDFIEDNKIDKSILPKNIKDSIKLDSKSGEFKIQKAELERIKTEMLEASDSEELKELKKEFNNYIKEQKIDRNSEDFKSVISDFESEFKNKNTLNTLTIEKTTNLEKLGIEYNKLKSILQPLEIELTLKGELNKAKEVDNLLDSFRSKKKLEKFINENIDYSKEYYERKYLNNSKIRNMDVLKALVDNFRKIRFTKSNISTFNAKIKATFNIDSNFKFSSIDDVKKFIKEIKI